MMRRSITVVVAVGLALSLLLGGAVSYFASPSPDGLERVADDQGIEAAPAQPAQEQSPFADYQTSGVDEGWMSGGIAEVVGVGLTFLRAAGLATMVRRRGSPAVHSDDRQPEASVPPSP